MTDRAYKTGQIWYFSNSDFKNSLADELGLILGFHGTIDYWVNILPVGVNRGSFSKRDIEYEFPLLCKDGYTLYGVNPLAIRVIPMTDLLKFTGHEVSPEIIMNDLFRKWSDEEYGNPSNDSSDDDGFEF